MPWPRPIERAHAAAMDWVSFGAVNMLQRRHPLPPGFAEQWHEYVQRWKGRTLKELYTVPEDYTPPKAADMPEAGRFSFPSPVSGDFARNNQACFDLFPSAAGWANAPTMIMAHGLMSVSDIGYRLWARRLNARGWNAVFMHLPYHYSRRTPRHLHGEYAVNAHLVRTAEGIRAAVQEVRVLAGLLRQKGGPFLGGWGTSYGGWIMALAACVEPFIQRLILVEPILDLDKAIWESPASATMRSMLRQAGLSREDLAPHLPLTCPSYHQPKTPGENIILVAGEYDKIAPPEQIEALAKVWKGAHYGCYRQGHVGYTLMPRSFALAHEVWADDFPEL